MAWQKLVQVGGDHISDIDEKQGSAGSGTNNKSVSGPSCLKVWSVIDL